MKVIACLAATLDGKIASAAAPRERFGSKADLAHLLNTRTQADAILAGGETFRQYPKVRRGDQTGKAPLQCILTRTFNLPPDAPLFKAGPEVPVLIFSPEPVSLVIRQQYPPHLEWVATGSGNPVLVIMQTLRGKGIQTLSVEGGGQVIRLFLEAQALDEFYLTLCPLFLGGECDPPLVSGPGSVFSIANAPRTQVLSQHWIDQELFLHLKLLYPALSG